MHLCKSPHNSSRTAWCWYAHVRYFAYLYVALRTCSSCHDIGFAFADFCTPLCITMD